ncbi:hypothetical protein [Tautonia rosea]|uniref:hypothetical protein n=1 Tax=Tautonia rosea TaxID=2728037 RepID=UPI001472BAE4|nr:hypothetical protein [Tautonia rosea]
MTVRFSFRLVLWLTVWVTVGQGPKLCLANDATNRLLERVPPEASMALVIEDLGDHLDQLAATPLVQRLKTLDPVQKWFDSDEGATLRRARRDVEAALGASIGQFTEGLLGQAVVLSLHLPPDAPPDAARGLLQTVVSDRELLERFIGVANGAELASGKLQRVEAREYNGISYSVRAFKDGRPDESYVLLEDDSFVWTNSEQLLRAVIDRMDDRDVPRLTDDPAVTRVRERLPDRAMLSLLIDPEFVSRLVNANPEDTAIDELPAPLKEILAAMDSLGMALEWREGPVLHVVEVFDADRLPAPVRAWASRSGEATALLSRIPDSALLTAVGHVDAPALHDLVVASVPQAQHDRVGTVLELFRGLLLGRDLRSEILPTFGPGVVGWVHAPKPDQPIQSAPAVLVASIGDPDAAEAIENALRTLLAFMSLDETNDEAPLRLEHQWHEGARISALMVGQDPGSPRVAFVVARGLIVLGTDLDAVAAVLSDASAERADRLPTALAARNRLFPGASTFAYLDVAALHRLAQDRRDDLKRFMMARPENDEDDAPTPEDVELLLELIPMFRGVYVTSSLSTDATIAHQQIGLITAD